MKLWTTRDYGDLELRSIRENRAGLGYLKNWFPLMRYLAEWDIHSLGFPELLKK